MKKPWNAVIPGSADVLVGMDSVEANEDVGAPRQQIDVE